MAETARAHRPPRAGRGAPTIAMVDDDRNVLAAVSMGLEAEGFRVRAYADCETALRGIRAEPVDLALLDIRMPRMDGMEMLARLRAGSDVPVIFVTSMEDEADEIRGLRTGADDYIRKPFSRRLLVERIRAVLRRHGGGAPPAAPRPPIERGALSIDLDRFACSWMGRPLHLTVTELLLLAALARNPGHVKTRDQLIDAAYGGDADIDDRAVDSHVKRLRKKFRAVDGGFGEIETLYGIGYRYRES